MKTYITITDVDGRHPGTFEVLEVTDRATVILAGPWTVEATLSPLFRPATATEIAQAELVAPILAVVRQHRFVVGNTARKQRKVRP